jgi:hypothetical protein
MATIVKPITKSESPNFRAILDAASTIQVAPPQRPKTAMLSIMKSNKILYLYSENIKTKDKLKKGVYKIKVYLK